MLTNSVTIIGRLTKEVEIRKTSTGKSVASFCLAVDNGKDKQGNDRPADFIDCQVWEKSAENMAIYTHKGNLVAVSGELKTRTYDRQDGSKAKVTEVSVQEWRNLSPKTANSNATQQNTYGNNAGQNAYQQPIQQPYNQGTQQYSPSNDPFNDPFNDPYGGFTGSNL